MANQNPYLPTFRSSYTGKSQNIGGSSPFHIDLGVLASLPWQEKIRAIDSLAHKYDSHGRRIEFSNQGVAGRVWDVNATPEQKKALYEAVTAAHRPRPGWDPLDFYVPFKSAKDRFQQGAVEGASIYIPGVPGGKITRGSGGGYGYFSEALDPSGRVVFRVGHGDINRPEEETEVLVAANEPDSVSAPTLPAQGKTGDELLVEKITELLTPKKEIKLSKYQGPSEDQYAKNAELIDQAAMKLLLESMEEREKPQQPAYAPTNTGALAAAMAQKGFLTPKSTI